ncbi:sensor histidine kinase [Haloarcula litorea]|uniref:sensor histidine kinase n=1 Tax=Haloarcula litorea TaxID=3032579 RepID=UPI0023E8C69D|nr:HAMP domain-containing sensor histidine kinase [Halomicroarcula sp. GDY20]
MGPIWNASDGDYRRLPLVLTVTGALLLGAGIAEGAYRAFGPPPLSVLFLAGMATSLPFSVVVVAGGYRLPETAVPARRYERITKWTAAGAALFGVLLAFFAPLLFETWLTRLGLLRWGLAIGTGGGFLAGFYNARYVTERIAAERARVRAEEAEDRQELLEYLNALLRHEVLNAATVIRGQATLAESTDDEHIDTIEREADELAAVVDDVRFLIRANGATEELSPVDLVAVVEEELARLTSRHEELAVETDLPGSARVCADDLVGHLFSNLFRNAVQHAESPPVRLAVTMRIEADSVLVRITDDGPGVPEQFREHLFDPGIDRQDRDSRLGTVIVGRLVDRYDGRIALVETGASGTTIEVALPRPDASAAPAGGTESSSA